MNFLAYTVNEAMVISIEGEFDAQAVKENRDAFVELLNINKDIVVDMSGVTFVDSSGIGVLVFLYKRLFAQGLLLTVIGIRGQVKDVFHTVYLDKAIYCESNLDDYLLQNYSKTVPYELYPDSSANY
ncbi:MAG: STAS domain-containing protein [Pseudomonadales bacterium]|nr:STAS domain-containing protein [Pseudomonadales bacterium]